MAKTIGLTFNDELAAAGLLGLPFAWGADGGFTFAPSMTPAQRGAVLVVYAAHDPLAAPPVPDPVTTPTTLEDMERILLANVPGMTKAKIDQAKRDRGKPIL